MFPEKDKDRQRVAWGQLTGLAPPACSTLTLTDRQTGEEREISRKYLFKLKLLNNNAESGLKDKGFFILKFSVLLKVICKNWNDIIP